MKLLLGSCRPSKIGFQNIEDFGLINIIFQACNNAAKIICRVIISCKFPVDDIQGVICHQHVVDIDIIMAHGMLYAVHIGVSLESAHEGPFFFKDSKQISLDLGRFPKEPFALIDRVIFVVSPVREIVALLMKCTDLFCNALHQLYILIIDAMNVMAILSEFRDLYAGFININISIICVCFGSQFLSQALILAVDEKLTAVTGVTEDIPFITDNKREQDICQPFFEDNNIADFFFCAV